MRWALGFPSAALIGRFVGEWTCASGRACVLVHERMCVCACVRMCACMFVCAGVCV